MDGGDICSGRERLERLRQSMGEGIPPGLPCFLFLQECIGMSKRWGKIAKGEEF